METGGLVLNHKQNTTKRWRKRVYMISVKAINLIKGVKRGKSNVRSVKLDEKTKTSVSIVNFEQVNTGWFLPCVAV